MGRNGYLQIQMLILNEVIAQFFAAGGSKPATMETLLQILVRSPGEINNSVFEEKVIGVDWGDKTRWVLVARNTINEINGLPLPEEDWQYHVSVNHTAMCENTEAIINRRNLGIYYFPEQAARTDVFIFEISQADAEEVSTSTGKQRRFSITSAHGYAALSYALLPYAFVQDYAEAGYNQNVMTRAPRFARRRFV
jgi:hypothetical protein